MGIIVESPGGSLDLPTIAKLLTPELLVWERTPTTGIMRIVSKARVARSFNGIVHSLDFGSVTVTLRINGSPVPGLTNLIPGTTPFRALASGGNVLPVDGTLEIVLSRVSSARGLSLQFEYDWII
jgi:hypothetical protein